MGQGRKHGQWSYRLLESHNSPDIKSLVKEERRLIQLSLRRLHPLAPPVAGRVKRGLKGQKGIPPMICLYHILYIIKGINEGYRKLSYNHLPNGPR